MLKIYETKSGSIAEPDKRFVNENEHCKPEGSFLKDSDNRSSV